MKIIADAHISPRTVSFLRSRGHGAVRLNEVLPSDARDSELIEYAREHKRVILTQDLDFSAIIALSNESLPSVISLRLSDSRVEAVNLLLERILPRMESEVAEGALISVGDDRVRIRRLPLK